MYPPNSNRGSVNHRHSGANQHSEDTLERQNDGLMGNLQGKITSLKNITIAIGDEVREQNRALDMMQNSMGGTDNMLNATLGRMQVMYKSHGSMSIVYLSLFVIATFLTVYGLAKWARG
uniref:t-SNARE coiled-coil homology domain-containing protein n=1 Tax=Hemiselmis andersenii TaxID=464988 RepID=A0A6U2CYA3_HEMAN|mmetsp:Transcript_22613/g.52479  ORF Transcript_22613/g.52479 Transcript_22613/m.52479 type:complete len:119 (+) Transcript_22613:285-641(+)